MRRLTAAFALVASAAALPGAAPGGDRSGAGLGPVAEVVMGTLSGPPAPAFLARVRHGRMGGVLLLGRWTSEAEIASATSALQEAACSRGEPLLVAVDQEGGAVRRLTWAPPTVAPAELGTTAHARRQASATAAALRRAGIGVDFAPVVDTPSSARSFLAARAFSRSPTLNARLAVAFVDGLQTAGIGATAKHFPGLGEAGANTDERPVTVAARQWKLVRGLLPFRSAIDDDVRLVMVSSASYPALDPTGKPAVFSHAIETELLRDELGFDGVAVTDALDAPAAARVPHAATRAIAAGADLLVFGRESASERAFAVLAADAPKYPHLRARLAESAERIRQLKTWLAEQGGPTCPSK